MTTTYKILGQATSEIGSASSVIKQFTYPVDNGNPSDNIDFYVTTDVTTNPGVDATKVFVIAGYGQSQYSYEGDIFNADSVTITYQGQTFTSRILAWDWWVTYNRHSQVEIINNTWHWISGAAFFLEDYLPENMWGNALLSDVTVTFNAIPNVLDTTLDSSFAYFGTVDQLGYPSGPSADIKPHALTLYGRPDLAAKIRNHGTASSLSDFFDSATITVNGITKNLKIAAIETLDTYIGNSGYAISTGWFVADDVVLYFSENVYDVFGKDINNDHSFWPDSGTNIILYKKKAVGNAQEVTIYTVPVQTQASISSIVVLNTDSTSYPFNLSFVPAVNTTAASTGANFAVYGKTILSGESQEINGGITLAPGDQIRFSSTSPNLVASVYGSEIS